MDQQITEGVIWKQILVFFFPIMLGAFFQQMYFTADTIIVGRFVGTQALAAVGSTGALVNLINGFFLGLGSGATVILSQFYGANDRKGAPGCGSGSKPRKAAWAMPHGIPVSISAAHWHP